MSRRCFSWMVLLSIFISVSCLHADQPVEADICIYGGTAGGVIAAAQAASMGKSAIIVETGNHLGGLSSGGLGATDIGNKAAIGGLSREFYRRLGKCYGREEAWTFEPSVAEKTFAQLVAESRVQVYFQEQLVSMIKKGKRIAEIRMANGSRFRAKMFIDASYEGDLMAMAKVAYRVGREANAEYGESLNGIRARTPKHQFLVPVDPYVRAGDSSSGLLPFIQRGTGGVPGAGDHRVQAYNFRLCFTTNAANRLPVAPPSDYDPGKYELLARYLEALLAAGHQPKLNDFWNPISLPGGKTDINNNGPFSTDDIGANYDYPEAGHKNRERIWKEHENYTRGFITFLASSPRVPENIRLDMQRWGPCMDEFQDTGGWPRQLYVREARRMVGDLVMTEHHCRGTIKAPDSIGLAAYNMDSHNCQRIVKSGRVENEGDVQVTPMQPYPISYRSIVSKTGGCENLFVPICLSATHIAYGSIRMEPVFMILCQSAATAASIAIDDRTSAQKVDYAKLRARLLEDKQILEWNSSTSP